LLRCKRTLAHEQSAVYIVRCSNAVLDRAAAFLDVSSLNLAAP
jgi:hypothetical protein